MTDEEKAIDYTDNIHIKYNEILSRPEVVDEIRKAFLAGLEAGKDMAEADLATIAYMQGAEQYKLKWHDLRKDPNDLPEPYTTVLDENSDKVEYIGYGKWQVYSEYYERYSEVDPPIAWCKTPTFKE